MENIKPQPDSATQAVDAQPPASYGLLFITRAYNRKEITLDEWLRQSRVWAEGIIRQHGKEQHNDKR